LPATVASGASYTNSDCAGLSGFNFWYCDENENPYMLGWPDLFNLTINRWEGPGGTATGHFSGMLYKSGIESDEYKMEISNGSLSIDICD
jgi:hypothetical protein